MYVGFWTFAQKEKYNFIIGEKWAFLELVLSLV
jgi:hypothetical protein